MKKVIFIVLLFSVFSVLADVDHTPEVVPSNLHVYNEHGNTYVDLVSQGCSQARYYIPENHNKYSTVISILLAAQMADKKVVGRFEGCNSNNQGRLIGVYLKDE